MSTREERPGTGEPEGPPERPEHDIALPPEVYCSDNLAGVAQSPRHHDVIAPTAAGDTLLVIVSTNNANANVTGVTDSKGNRYVLDGSSTVTPTTWVYRCEGRTGGPTAGQPTLALTLADRMTITCNGSVSMNVGIMAVHVPGLGPCDQRIFNSGANETGWTQTRTPQGPGQFCVSLAAHQAGGNLANWDPPFTKLVQQNRAQELSCAYWLAAGAGGQVVTSRVALSGGPVNWRAQLWTFDPELSILTEALPAGTEGMPYPGATLEAQGGRPAHAWALASGVLPAGLTLTGAGVLAGNLAAGIADSYPVTFRCTDAAGTAVTRAYVIVVRPAVRVTTAELPEGALGQPYDAPLDAAGGLPPYGWAATGLPPGLAVAGARITGTPTAGGDYDAEIAVTDAEGGRALATLPITIVQKPPLVITTEELPPGRAGQPYAVTIAAEGGAPSYTWSDEGSPPGLGIDSGTGLYQGVLGPNADGDWQPVITCADQDGDEAQRTYELHVEPKGTVEIVTVDLPRGYVGVPYEAALEAEGGEVPYLWDVAGLPPGLAVAEFIWPSLRAFIRGTPTEIASADVSARVTDWAGDTAEAELLLTVAEQPEPEPEPEPPPPRLVPVIWAGLDCNAGNRADGLTLVCEEVNGWYGTPPLNGHDIDRVLTDGSVFGAKVTGARVVTLTGAAAGPHAALVALARELAARAAARQPAPLSIGEHDDPEAPLLTAMVRADEDRLEADWHGRCLLRWQVALSAADPRLYEEPWRQAALALALDPDTGRDYPLAHPRAYALTVLPNAARLANPGNVPAPVLATWVGPLGETRVSDGARTIHVAPLGPQQEILVDTGSLVAVAPGGASRASYILPGSQPMAVPRDGTATWRLYGTGSGRVELRWRGAWT
jgi:putative Ig domain-containing protein